MWDSMGLTEEIVATACEVATAGTSRIAACARSAASCEGRLKVGLSHALDGRSGLAVMPEVGNVDLTVRRGDEPVLCELKTFPTDCGRAGKPEPVPPQWPGHLAKVRRAAAEQLHVTKIRLDGPRLAHLDVMLARQEDSSTRRS